MDKPGLRVCSRTGCCRKSYSFHITVETSDHGYVIRVDLGVTRYVYMSHVTFFYD
jgi:hypothetical protein